ncbi:MAG TPA: NAD(P)H-hydrate dehydratase [Candidatus Nanoarchaeia archaeon]|nr:NAD(P)H-hydrate dehydratase [Candidatus Nanoarchaeia archaeon]
MRGETYLRKSDLKLPRRKAASHKGQNGRVLAIGGSGDYVGAIALAGLAALRSGVDIVVVAAPEKTAWAVNCLSPDLITKKFSGKYFTQKHAGDIIKLSKSFDVVLIGNGLGLRNETKEFVRKVVKSVKCPLVIDADAIKALRIQDICNAIITPHFGELEILLGNSKIGKNEIQKYVNGNVILLKGPTDTIISKSKVVFNKTGNAGMTKGGTGDVLAGLCAGYLAQSHDLFQSACNAAYINGMIGDILLKKKKGFTYLASDMVGEIGRVAEKFSKD